MDPISISSTSALNHNFMNPPQATLPAAPPELVSKFDALMHRTNEPSIGSISESPALKAAVAGVDAHLAHYSHVAENVMKPFDEQMSLAEIQTQQAQNMVQMGLLSMNQTAMLEVVSSAKGSVSSLMKNQ